MPSRAVIRKKARREAARIKKAKTESQRVMDASSAQQKIKEALERANIFPKHSTVTVKAKPVAPPKREPEQVAPREKRSSRKEQVAPPEQSVSEQEEVSTPDTTVKLTRKERKKMESTKRLEKQISRLNVVAAAAAPAEAEGTGAPKLRHDPRSTGGTFWRTRKEKKARTVFLGGIPAHFTKEQITDFILTILDSNEAAAPYLEEKGSSSAVEEIDVIGHRPQGKIQNLYVTMASVGLAGCCIAGLDGYRLAGKNLRCNFSADKSQRALAIKKRKE